MSLNTFKIGYPAPDFNLLSVDGSKFSLQSFSGKKAVIIVFTCNHCPYAQAYENRIIQIQKDYSENLQVIAINSNDDSEYPDDSFENMKERAKNKSFNLEMTLRKLQKPSMQPILLKFFFLIKREN